METEQHRGLHRSGETGKNNGHTALIAACFLAIATYVLLCDIKGVDTDEGLRLGIMNGGQQFSLNNPPTHVRWDEVMQANFPFAYQPLYFLIQNTAMSVAQTQDGVFLKLVNICFFWVSLQGLISLSKRWQLLPRLFLIGVFSFNAYLIMHVLQIREYILAVAFYIWSSWLVLRLEERKLGREWADVSWFVGYGALLTLGFYVQTWVVFPAIGQFLFLIVQRKGGRFRFYAHLALSYLIVLTATVPYLRANIQKVNVGRWGAEGTSLWSQLSDGFHLVLSGHVAGHSSFADFLFWFWLIVIGSAGVLLFSKRPHAAHAASPLELKRQGLLMLLSMAVPLGFQIVYFYRNDNLSVWPRYFVVYYFFLTWLLALAVRYLDALASASETSLWVRRILRTSVGAVLAVMLASSVYQVASYYENPFFDTGLSRASNWRTLSAEISRVLKPDDVMLVNEFINRSTLTFTRPIPNRVLMLAELEHSDIGSVNRMVYLESVSNLSQRDALAARMAELGFDAMKELRIHATDGNSILTDWRLLVFQRR